MINNIIIFLHSISVYTSAIMLCIAIIKRNSPKSLYFTLMNLAMFLYTIGYFLEITSTTQSAAITALKLEYFGLPFIAPFSFLFIMDFCGKTLRKFWQIISLFILPYIVCVLSYTWESNHILFGNLEYTQHPLPHLIITPSPMYVIAFTYAAILLTMGVIVMIQKYIHADHNFKKQARLLFIGASLPLATSCLALFGLSPFDFDFTPIMLTVTLSILAHSIFRLDLLALVPYAKDDILENMNDAFILIDYSGNLLDFNKAAHHIFPVLDSSILGTQLLKLDQLKEIISPGNLKTNEFTMQIDGETKYYRTSNSVVNYQNKAIGICIIIYDVTEIRILMNELNEIATFDALTSIYNRGTFFRLANHEFEHIKKYDLSGALIMMDIDYFKRINDTYGHLCGDIVLKGVADILKKRFRSNDLYARYGGEELCAFLNNTSLEQAHIIAESIRKTIEETVFESDGKTFHITISVGIGVYDSNKHKNLEALILTADNALYRAKEGGRNRVCS